MSEPTPAAERVHEAWCPFDGRVADPDHVCWLLTPPAVATGDADV